MLPPFWGNGGGSWREDCISQGSLGKIHIHKGETEEEREKEIYYKELAHAIIAADRTRFKRANGKFQGMAKGLRTRRGTGVSFSLSLSPKAGD